MNCAGVLVLGKHSGCDWGHADVLHFLPCRIRGPRGHHAYPWHLQHGCKKTRELAYNSSTVKEAKCVSVTGNFLINGSTLDYVRVGVIAAVTCGITTALDRVVSYKTA